MPRPNPIEYAERLYAAIRAANFSPISFLAFGNAVKEGVELRRMPRIAAEPFMRVVGDMLNLEDISDRGDVLPESEVSAPGTAASGPVATSVLSASPRAAVVGPRDSVEGDAAAARPVPETTGERD